MDSLLTIVTGILSKHAEEYWSVVVDLVVSWLTGFAITDYIKRYRASRDQKRPPDITFRTYAILIAFTASMALSIVIFKAPADQSVIVSIFCGIMCPILFKWLMKWARTAKPDLYATLKVKFMGDDPDPNATGQF